MKRLILLLALATASFGADKPVDLGQTIQNFQQQLAASFLDISQRLANVERRTNFYVEAAEGFRVISLNQAQLSAEMAQLREENQKLRKAVESLLEKSAAPSETTTVPVEIKKE